MGTETGPEDIRGQGWVGGWVQITPPEGGEVSNQAPLNIRSTAMLTFPCDATSARTHAALSVNPMSFIWPSCAAYVSSGFAATGGVTAAPPVATAAAAAATAAAALAGDDGVALGVDACDAFEDELLEAVPDGGVEVAAGGVAQGFVAEPVPAPPPALTPPAPPSNVEKSRPPAAGAPAGHERGWVGWWVGGTHLGEGA